MCCIHSHVYTKHVLCMCGWTYFRWMCHYCLCVRSSAYFCSLSVIDILLFIIYCTVETIGHHWENEWYKLETCYCLIECSCICGFFYFNVCVFLNLCRITTVAWEEDTVSYAEALCVYGPCTLSICAKQYVTWFAKRHPFHTFYMVAKSMQ